MIFLLFHRYFLPYFILAFSFQVLSIRNLIQVFVLYSSSVMILTPPLLIYISENLQQFLDQKLLYKNTTMVKALIIVDPQNDFCEGGSLAVPNSNQIFEPINQIKTSPQFDHVFITMDWHDQKHISFAQNHGLQPFSSKVINGKEEILWPVHCLQNSNGAKINELLKISGNEIIVKKGIVLDEQQYSGFGTKRCPTQLEKNLQNLNIDQVYVVGLALDFCVGNTALDAKDAGLEVTVIKDCTRGVAGDSSQKMLKRFEEKGVDFKSLTEII